MKILNQRVKYKETKGKVSGSCILERCFQKEEDMKHSNLPLFFSGADSAGGAQGARAPPAVTPSMGIYILFYNALITF